MERKQLLQRYVACVEYSGTHFKGFQAQGNPPVRTVESILNFAVSQIAGENIQIIGAGRTDAGVHAAAQMIHFDSHKIRPLNAWLRGINAHLPCDCAIQWIKPAPENFHARFSATSRCYTYKIWNHPTPSPLRSQYTTWVPQALSIELMREASLYLLGEQDFSALRSSECQARSPVRQIYTLDIQSTESLIEIHVHANGFLHHMVRNIVGTLLMVGKKKHPPEWVKYVIQNKQRALAGPTAKPEGLHLMKVIYPFNF